MLFVIFYRGYVASNLDIVYISLSAILTNAPGVTYLSKFNLLDIIITERLHVHHEGVRVPQRVFLIQRHKIQPDRYSGMNGHVDNKLDM